MQLAQDEEPIRQERSSVLTNYLVDHEIYPADTSARDKLKFEVIL